MRFVSLLSDEVRIDLRHSTITPDQYLSDTLVENVESN